MGEWIYHAVYPASRRNSKLSCSFWTGCLINNTGLWRNIMWYDWLLGLSPVLALLADLCFKKLITRVIFGISLAVVIVYYIIRDFIIRRHKWKHPGVSLRDCRYSSPTHWNASVSIINNWNRLQDNQETRKEHYYCSDGLFCGFCF